MGKKQEITVKKRLQIIKLHLEENVPILRLQTEYGYDRATIKKWIQVYNSKGEKGLHQLDSTHNAKVPPLVKLQIVKEYKEDNVTFMQLQAKYGYARRSISKWVSDYDEYGESGLTGTRKHNIRYDKAFKLKVINEALTSGLGHAEIARKYDINERSINKWIEKYQSAGDLGLQRVDTFEHRYTTEFKEYIVQQHKLRNLSFREIEKRYLVSYETVRSWVRKYEDCGLSGLETKAEKTGDTLENINVFKLRRMDLEEDDMDIMQLHRKIKLLTIENEYLKKVQTLDLKNSLKKKK